MRLLRHQLSHRQANAVKPVLGQTYRLQGRYKLKRLAYTRAQKQGDVVGIDKGATFVGQGPGCGPVSAWPCVGLGACCAGAFACQRFSVGGVWLVGAP